MLRYIIALLFEPIMIPYWERGYMGGNRHTWFKLSVIQDISIELLEYKKRRHEMFQV